MHPLDHYPDSAFPLVHGWRAGERPMIDLPHRGNGLQLHCMACDRTVFFGGRDLVLKFPDWLDRPVGVWAAALRCHACSSRRITIGALNDPGSQGFSTSTMETGQTVWARRLATWLAEVDRDIRSYRSLLEGLPRDEDLKLLGLLPAELI